MADGAMHRREISANFVPDFNALAGAIGQGGHRNL